MIIVYIKEGSFFKNVDWYGNIFEVENAEFYLENGFTKVELEDQYKDCEYHDFNQDLTFSVEKYNARKQRENADIRISELKQLLKDTDYKALKYAEGVISAIDYLPTQRERQAWRDEINDLENLTK